MILETAFKNAVARVTDQRGKPATLGKSDGNTLHWTDLNGMTHRTRVWARVGESASNQAVVVDCIKVPPQIDMPVRVDYVNGVLSVVDVDYKRAVEFGGGRPPGAGGAHAWMHSRLGPDPVYIEGLQYLPLLVTPTNPADLTVTVQAGAYYDLSGDLQVFDTAVSGSTSAYVPSSEYHFVIICLDRSDGSIVIVDGDDIAATDVLFSDVAVTAADVEAITISADYWPLAVVLLGAGQTQIKAKEIVMDLRPIGSTGGSSTPGGSDTQIQYNDGGAFGGDASLVWDNTGKTLIIEKSTSTTLESFLELTQTGTGGAFVNFTAGTTSGRVGVTSTAFRISSGYAVSISGDTLGLTASDYVLFDPGGYSNIRFQGSGSNPAAVFNLGNYSNYNFQVLTGNNDYMVFVDSSLDAFQIGNSSAGTIADFRSTAIVLNEAGADLDLRVETANSDSTFIVDGGADSVSVGTNGSAGSIASFAPGGVVINNAEADIDFRIAGNGVTNGYFYDAGNDRTGLGTNTPATKLHVYHPVDTLADIAHFGDGTYGFWFRNTTGAGFAPYMFGVTEEADDPLIFGAQIDPAIDTGTRACVWLDARQSDGTAVETRPIAQITNLGVSQLGVYPGGHVVCETTTGAFRPNTLTTTQRNALTAVNGMLIYNSTTGKFQGRAAGSWVDLH